MSKETASRPSPREAGERAHLAALVSGRVQGVGFRVFVRRQARALGLSGWVRNLADGTVALEAEGPKWALEALARRLREGPSDAIVEQVELRWREEAGWDRGFEVTR